MKATEALKITQAARKEIEEREPYMYGILRMIETAAKSGMSSKRVDSVTMNEKQREALKELGYKVRVRADNILVEWGE